VWLALEFDALVDCVLVNKDLYIPFDAGFTEYDGTLVDVDIGLSITCKHTENKSFTERTFGRLIIITTAATRLLLLRCVSEKTRKL